MSPHGTHHASLPIGAGGPVNVIITKQHKKSTYFNDCIDNLANINSANYYDTKNVYRTKIKEK
jgi:hypothetical protein